MQTFAPTQKGKHNNNLLNVCQLCKTSTSFSLDGDKAEQFYYNASCIGKPYFLKMNVMKTISIYTRQMFNNILI